MNALTLLIWDGARSLLSVRIPLWAAGALVLLLLCGLLLERCQLAGERSARAAAEQHAGQLEQQVGAAQQQVTQFRSVLEEQNRSIAEWHAEADEQQARADIAEDRAQQVRVEWRDRIVEVERATVPDDCAGAVDWLAGEEERLSQAWREGQ